MPAPAIDTVLLDLGNVLVFHDDRLLLDRFSHLSELSPDRIKQAWQPLWPPVHRGEIAGDDLRREVCARAGVDLDAEAFFTLWNCHFRVHDAVLPLVESLLARVKVVLLSNTNQLHWRFLRPKLPVLDRFAGLVLSHEVGLCKPEPAIFKHALSVAGSRPETTAYFDDLPAYVDAAQALGINSRVFTTAEAFRRQLAALNL